MSYKTKASLFAGFENRVYVGAFVFAAFVMSILLIACSKKNADDTKARKGNVSSINVKRLAKKWKHVKTKDSYDGIWKDMDTADSKVISFTRDGKYSENRHGNPLCKGGYTMEGDNVILTHSCNKVALTCKVVELEKKKLTMSMMGRHGEVFYVYERTK